MHWPIIRMLYDKAHISNNNIIAFVVGAIVCFTTAGIGVILKKYCRFSLNRVGKNEAKKY